MAEDKGTTRNISETAQKEEAVQAFWKENSIVEKVREKKGDKGEFIFYEGPPSTNGLPGIHHLEPRAFKDAITRYKILRGYTVERRAGWDTHGLPVELQVEKELGFTGKGDIEKYGIEAFNKKCRESVYRFIDVWARFSSRIGYWADLSKAYSTCDASFMESEWAILKKVYDDGRLYKDYKVLPWCARCGTALSSHELAQGYEDVKDLSVTARFKVLGEENTYILAWTTTPWTLLGNVALAVGKDIDYGVYEGNGEKIILAKARAEILPEGYTLQSEVKGSDLVGKLYEPLFPYLKDIAPSEQKEKFEKAYQVHAADFVTTEDGTGVVHTAVMYGADDFDLGTKIGLPKVHTVAMDGKFVAGTGAWEGRFVKDEEVAIDVVKDLAGRGLLFAKEKYSHSYPHCWRCKTPLIYYARDSWYIRMHDLASELLSENAKVNWEPAHIRDGRMGEWLGGVKDWALSRERYWGTPLPVWENQDKTKRLVVGSVDDLKKYGKKSGNTYLIMRHGESENNVLSLLNSGDREKYGLTETGKQQAIAAGTNLANKNITKIYSSPFRRAKETAMLTAQALGLSPESVIIDERLREFEFGELDGTSHTEYIEKFFPTLTNYEQKVGEGESYLDGKKRFGDFLYELERNFKNENILIVSHGIAFESCIMAAKGADKNESLAFVVGRAGSAPHATPTALNFVPLPLNEDYELDLHRPYIDDITLEVDGEEYTRVKEVIDVWFDSGAMPFAQDHYPFENKERVDSIGFPADYISEAIDQTRGWFYTLLAVGVLMGKGHAYKNVICLGHLLDAEGRKMSKSKGNVVEPFEEMDIHGADTVRFWMYHVNQPGDSKNYDIKTIKEAARIISWFDNSAGFYELFKDVPRVDAPLQVIDRWMLQEVNETARFMTERLDAYDVYAAARRLGELISDLSQWYVRRIRDRVRDGDSSAMETLTIVLKKIAILLAPFAPYISEKVYQQVRSEADAESVHLSTWDEGGSVADATLRDDMARVRELVSSALMMRQQSNIKVRQPLSQLSIKGPLPKEFRDIVQDEVNVHEVVENAADLSLDTTLTPELILEGDEREKARAIADARKQLGLSPRDSVTVTYGEGPYKVELSTGSLSFDVVKNAS